MAKQQRRKPQKRAPVRNLDDELIELAGMIYECKLDNNAAGWFSIPWRDGWHAVALAHEAAYAAEKACQTREGCIALLAPLGHWIYHQETGTEAYQDAGDILETSSLHSLTRAAYRCFQVLVARSDGGGMVYNVLLRPIFETMLPEDVAELVLTWRQRDALGPFYNERRAKAFQIAWRRGLYRAAYAL